jgi:hypothetical protein
MIVSLNTEFNNIHIRLMEINKMKCSRSKFRDLMTIRKGHRNCKWNEQELVKLLNDGFKNNSVTKERSWSEATRRPTIHPRD